MGLIYNSLTSSLTLETQVNEKIIMCRLLCLVGEKLIKLTLVYINSTVTTSLFGSEPGSAYCLYIYMQPMVCLLGMQWFLPQWLETRGWLRIRIYRCCVLFTVALIHSWCATRRLTQNSQMTAHVTDGTLTSSPGLLCLFPKVLDSLYYCPTPNNH